MRTGWNFQSRLMILVIQTFRMLASRRRREDTSRDLRGTPTPTAAKVCGRRFKMSQATKAVVFPSCRIGYLTSSQARPLRGLDWQSCGCVLSHLLLTLYSNGSTFRNQGNAILKYADYATIIGIHQCISESWAGAWLQLQFPMLPIN